MINVTNGAPAHLLDAAWRKPSASNSKGKCAELAHVGGQVAIRQNTDPTGPALIMAPGEFAGFVADAKAGRYDDLLLA